MMFVSYPALYQEPENLMQAAFSIDEIREAEINNLQVRIIEAAGINAKRAKWLNWLRIAAAISPLIFALVAAISPAKEAPVPITSKVVMRQNLKTLS